MNEENQEKSDFRPKIGRPPKLDVKRQSFLRKL